MKLRYGRLFQDRLDGEHGLPRRRLEELARRFAAIQAEVRTRRAGGEYGFYRLADQEKTVRQITTFSEGLGQAYDHVLVLGIGGSALGTRALLGALRPPAWNELDDEAREFFPRLTLLDNVDPTSVAAALRRIDPRRVLVNVVSKSGGTAETLAQYVVVRRWLEESLGGAVTGHLVFTTDPAKGALRELATREGIATLEVPPDVGGRYSVLSPVGLLPAALVGVDIAELLAGAARAVARAENDDLLRNPAALLAGLLWSADTQAGARIDVVMPYSDRLREFAEWFRQLWAESLGKRVDREGKVVHVGPTPIGAVGTTDQHSQVQLFIEGPYDKVITFVTVADPGEDVPIPAIEGMPEEVACLGGRTLDTLLKAEYEATSAALARQGRMNCTLELPDLSPASVGELLMFFQVAVGYAGCWYGINPFDQPGVELGKRLTFGALGRTGFEPPPPAPDDDADSA
jgi:glucose-6-phosphate isomerase